VALPLRHGEHGEFPVLFVFNGSLGFSGVVPIFTAETAEFAEKILGNLCVLCALRG